MVTNQVLLSSDRTIFGTTIRQETKTGFLSINDLQAAYEAARMDYGWTEKRIDHVTQTNDFIERAYYVIENQRSINPLNKGFIETADNQRSINTPNGVSMGSAENQAITFPTLGQFKAQINAAGIVKTLKSMGMWKATGARGTNAVWCNAYIWVLIALEMNPMMYAKVVMWLTDNLIFNRIEAGDKFMPMNAAINSILPTPDYYKYAVAINKKVFGKHLAGMRNLASASNLKSIAKVEELIVTAIENGWVKTEEEIISAIEKFKF